MDGMNSEGMQPTTDQEVPRDVPPQTADTNNQLRLVLIERINSGDLAAGACYLNYPIGPEITQLELSAIEGWKTSKERINDRCAPQIFAVLSVEVVQRSIGLAGETVLGQLETARNLIWSAPLADAVVVETLLWLSETLYKEENDEFAPVRKLLAELLDSPRLFRWPEDDAGQDDANTSAELSTRSGEPKQFAQLANEQLIAVRRCRGPHKARWFIPYDSTISATGATPLDSSQAAALYHQLRSAERYFHQTEDRVGLAMAGDQRALLRTAGIAEQDDPKDTLSLLCQAAERYADANDPLREMFCWQRAVSTSSPNGLQRPLPEPIKYIITKDAEASHRAGVDVHAEYIKQHVLGKPPNSRLSKGIALAVFVLLAAAFFKGDDTLAFLAIVGCALVVHEAGHWIAGRLAGIRIAIFRVGLGPRLFSKQLWDTDIEVHAFPVMGYVCPAITTLSWEKHRSLRSASPDYIGQQIRMPPESFCGEPVGHSELVSRPRQILFILGGVAANLLVAMLSFWLFSFLDVQSRTHPSPVIGYVWAGGKGSVAGIQVGDQIVSVQGKPCRYFGDDVSGRLLRYRSSEDPASLPVMVLREGEEVLFEWPLITKEEWDGLGIGVTSPASWIIDEVHTSCADFMKPGDVIEQASWGEHIVRRDEGFSPHILRWMFAQARDVPVSLRVRSGRAFREVKVHPASRAMFDPELFVDLESRLVDVVQGSVAWQAGLRPGDLIRAIGSNQIETHREMIAGLRAIVNQAAQIVIEREGELLTLEFPGRDAFRDYANLGLTSSDWSPRLKGLAVTAIRPEWADAVPNLKVGQRLEAIDPIEPYLFRWRDEEGNLRSQDLSSVPNVEAFLGPVWFPPFRLKRASITLPPDSPMAIAVRVLDGSKNLFKSLPRNVAVSATQVPSSSERQWIRQAVARGYPRLLEVWASMNMAFVIFNLLPIPPLDGFRLVQILAGGVTRRKLPRGIRTTLNIIGVVIMLALSGLFFYEVIRDAVTAFFM